MKKLSSILAAVLLSSTISSVAFAADKPIQVLIDNKPVQFDKSAPIQENGSISVPFRTLFEELGLKVNWNQKENTITGTKDGLVISLQLNNKQATVNGEATTLTVAPKIINNVTYVPLRFVSEATGNDVKWESKSQRVYIITTNTDAEAEAIQALLDQFVKTANEEDLTGLMSLIHPKSPLAQLEAAFKEQVDTYDTETTMNTAEILNLTATEATVHTSESTHKTKGPFMLDSTSDIVYSLVKDASTKTWKIFNVQLANIQYHLSDEELNAAVTVPKADADLIIGAMQDNLKYSNEENIDGLLSTLELPQEAVAQVKESFKQLFAAYDLQFSIDSTKIIYFSDNEAALYAVQTTKKLKGPEFQDNTSKSVTSLKKTDDGKWKLVQTFVLDAQPLQP